MIMGQIGVWISRTDADRAFVKKGLSIYLDALRVICSVAVMVGHAVQDGVYDGDYFLDILEHERVIILFVLSGMLITHASSRKTDNLRSYTIARASRIISASYPAILFSFLLSGVAALFLIDGLRIADIKGYSAGSAVSSFLFLNKIWLNPAEVPWNFPFWSICYEVFYYAMFGALAFLNGNRRWILLVCIGLLAGPAILVLFPVWLAGSFILYSKRLRIASPMVGAVVAVATMTTIFVMSEMEVHKIVKSYLHDHVSGWWMLRYSQSFLTDYVVGMLVVLHFCGVQACNGTVEKLLIPLEKYIRLVAGFSFSIYLFHRPITTFSAKMGIKPADDLQFTLYLLVVVAIIYGLSRLGEARRDGLRKWIERRLAGKAAQAPV